MPVCWATFIILLVFIEVTDQTSTSTCLFPPSSDYFSDLSMFIVYKLYVPVCVGFVFYIHFWWIFLLFQVWSWIMNKTWTFEQVLNIHAFAFLGKCHEIGFLVTQLVCSIIVWFNHLTSMCESSGFSIIFTNMCCQPLKLNHFSEYLCIML